MPIPHPRTRPAGRHRQAPGHRFAGPARVVVPAMIWTGVILAHLIKALARRADT